MRARLEHLAPGGRWRGDFRADLPRLRWFHFELPQLRLTEILDVWVGKMKEPRFVVVDAGRHFTQALGYTWRMDHASRDGMLRALHGLQRWAVRNRIGVLCLARTSRGGAGAATRRHFGIADALLSLDRRGDMHVLDLVSRDFAERELMLDFEDDRFTFAGDVGKAGRWGHREKILAMASAAGGSVGPSEAAVALGLPLANVTRTMARMAEAGVLERLGRGRYRTQNPP